MNIYLEILEKYKKIEDIKLAIENDVIYILFK